MCRHKSDRAFDHIVCKIPGVVTFPITCLAECLIACVIVSLFASDHVFYRVPDHECDHMLDVGTYEHNLGKIRHSFTFLHASVTGVPRPARESCKMVDFWAEAIVGYDN